MPLFLSLIMTLLRMAHSADLDQGVGRIKIAVIIEDSIYHVKAFEVIRGFCRQTNSSRMKLLLETLNLTSNHPAFMDGRVGPLLGENVEFILWIVTCETLDFLPNKLQAVNSPSIFLSVAPCSLPKPTQDIDILRYIAIADVIERLQWPDVNIIYDNSIGGGAILLLLKELSTRFIKSSLCSINTTSDDYNEKIFEKFIRLNQKGYAQNQFLLILKNETLAKVLHSANILMMTMGKLYWILIEDNLQPNDLIGFGVNPQNTNMLLFRKACDRERKDLRKVNEMIDDLKEILPTDKNIQTLICMVMESLDSRRNLDLKTLAKCTARPFDSMSNTNGILMSTESRPSNSCYPAFEVTTLNAGQDGSIANTIARWRPDIKLIVKGEFFPNKHYKLGNATLRVSAVALSPYIIRVSSGNDSEFIGFAVTILNELSLRMNFSYVWREPEDRQFGILNNGSFSGLVGQLEKREVDLVVGALSVSYDRSLVIDYTYPYTEEGRGLLMKKPSESSTDDLFKVFRAFSPITWLSFAVAVVVVAVALAIVDGFKRMTDSNNTIRGLPDNKTAKKICLFSHLSWKETLWSIYTMHLFQGGAQEPTPSRSRVIVTSWWLFTILISTYYTANLTAQFTIEDAPSTIESLGDLANDESLVPITLDGSLIYEELRSSNDPIKVKIFNRLKHAPNKETALESLDMVQSGKYVLISLWSEVKTIAAEYCEDLMVVGKPYDVKRIAFALPRGSALSADVSLILGIMREAGLIEKWRRAWWKEKASCRKSDDQQPKILDMKSIGGVYIVFGALVIISFVILGWEIMTHKLNKRKRITLDDVAQY